MRFPHLYGPLPVAAVTSVVTYRPGPGGAFGPPSGIPPIGDPLARAAAFERSLAERRAAAVALVSGGVACLDPRVPASWEHNSLWLTGDLDAAAMVAEADRVLAAFPHRRIVTVSPPPSDLGWEVEEMRFQVFDASLPVPPVPSGRVVAVTQEVMAGLWAPTWRREIPGIDDDAVGDLVRRESFAVATVGSSTSPCWAATVSRWPAPSCALTGRRPPSMGDDAPSDASKDSAAALVGDAVRRARSAGCDVIWLRSRADGWPRHWYARIGFVDVGCRWEVVRR